MNTLPTNLPNLQRTYDEIVSQMRRRKSTRGWAIIVMLLLCTAAVPVLLDFLFDLPRYIRSCLFVIWVVIAIWAYRRFVLLPWHQPIDQNELASRIESHYPNFGERLLTLSSIQDGTASGSPQLTALLKKECEKRANQVVPKKVLPETSTRYLAVLAALIACVSAMALAIVPGGGQRARRFILPWYDPAMPVDFQIMVSSGNPLIRRGDSLNLTAFLERVKVNAEFPKSIDVIVRDGKGNEKLLPMTGDERGTYALPRTDIQNDFEYRIKYKRQQTEWYKVSVADPVLTADGTRRIIHPPEYARSAFPEQTLPGFREFEAVEFSKVELHFFFDRPPSRATLEFVSELRTESILLRLGADSKSAIAELTVRESGKLMLTLFEERGLASTMVAAVKSIKDTPPEFTTINGLSQQGFEIQQFEIQPGERIPINVSAKDDISITELAIEYRVSDSQKTFEVIKLKSDSLNTQFADARTIFDTSGLAPVGSTLYIRLRATDNRKLGEFNLSPQSTYFPPNNWLALRITASAKPLAEQQVFSQRDKINDSLQKSIQQFRDAKANVEKVYADRYDRLSDDQLVRLSQAKTELTQATEQLLATQKELLPHRDLNTLSEGIQSLITGPIQKATESINSGSQSTDAKNRRSHLELADNAIQKAINDADLLIKKNEQIAQDRLDRKRIAELANEEQELIDELKRAKTDSERAALEKKQQNLRERLESVIRNSEGLRKLLDAASANRAAEQLNKAKDLQKLVQDLEAQRNEIEKNAIASKNAEFAKSQAALADQISKTIPDSRNGARSAQASADKFNKGQALDAMSEQSAAAAELEQYAEKIEQMAMARKDPKEAAEQIAQWQKSFADRFTEATKKASFEQLPEQAKQRLLAEHSLIQKAVESILAPRELKEKKENAVNKAKDAHNSIRNPSAGSKFRDAAKATEELAAKMPKLADRLKKG